MPPIADTVASGAAAIIDAFNPFSSGSSTPGATESDTFRPRQTTAEAAAAHASQSSSSESTFKRGHSTILPERSGPPAIRDKTYAAAATRSHASESSNPQTSTRYGSITRAHERDGPSITQTRPPYNTRSVERTTPRTTTNIPRTTTKMYTDDRRAVLRSIADETLIALDKGTYSFNGVDYKLDGYIRDSQKNTKYFDPDSSIASWASTQPRRNNPSPAHISVLQISTLDAARLLENTYKMQGHVEHGKTGVLNFASATQAGGGFKNGAEAQEESIARSSTLYASLAFTEEASKFYNLHLAIKGKHDEHAYYTHAIIYSPKICVFRDDDGVWTYPFAIDVLSCAAVNAGEIRKASNTVVQTGLEVEIEKQMSERMGRILYVFEKQGIRNLVLGTFGTGVFRNNVGIVARLWAHLLVVSDARFKYSFERIIFAITGEETFAEFQSAFDAWSQPPAPRPLNSNRRRGDLIEF